MKYTVQIVGVGGQGVLLASMVLGKAAMEAGHKVAMSEVHGMAQRGGSVLSTLRFGDDVISPLESVGGADMILGFEPVETCRNIALGNKDTAIIVNLDPLLPSAVAAGFEEYPPVQDIVDSIRSVSDNLMTIDATKIAVEAGRAVAANAAMIGAVTAAQGFPLPGGLLKKTLLDTVPEKFKELNSRAFDMGAERCRRA
ncbi:MAG: indolepyruvate oxidoreductase subunit beta [Candidatus Methanoplasma sp.]|jgi:indolepyruvate ferredoxin oxidoreductase beta subunit|nr:indolepyruvate oxidoreductase subunit beta [Candidatus Methanoplasma sp.]